MAHLLSTKEMGLLKVAASHKRSAISAAEALKHAEKTIIALAKLSLDPEKAMWNYIEGCHQWWNGDSSRLGVYTTIGDWELKSGKIIRAHLTEHGNFIHRATEEGEYSKPISYNGNFHITRARFQFFMNEQGKHIADFFEPIPLKRIVRRPIKCA